MNRAFYISGIVLSVIFFFTSAYYISEVHNARMSYIFSDYGLNAYDYGYQYGASSAASLTEEGGLVALIFFLAFIAIDILGLLKVKTTTMKVMGIIGLSISGIFLIWNLLMMSSPGSLSFDEVGIGFLLYCIIILAFCIVGLVQSVRYVKMSRNGSLNATAENRDILDS